MDDENQIPEIPVPAWLAPILACEADEAQRLGQHGERAAGAVNRRLADLGIEPVTPAKWVPHALLNAVLLRPDTVDADELGVRAGWHGDHVALYAYDPHTRVEHYVGPLHTAQDAAAARFGPRHAQPAPVDHAQRAEEHLNDASRVGGEDLDPFETALLEATCAQARTLLAVNETLSRIGVRLGLRQLLREAELAGQPGAQLTDGERRLLSELFPRSPAAADGAPDSRQAQRDQQASDIADTLAGRPRHR